MEGVRTEELSGSNLHNYLNRLIKKSDELFSLFTYYYIKF